MGKTPLFLKQVEVGLMSNFNYLLGDTRTGECAYIDPAWEVDRVLKVAQENGMRVTKILLTHNHFDHIEGVEKAVEATGAEVCIHASDAGPLKKAGTNVLPLSHGMEIAIGAVTITVLHTPGHTPGSVCFLAESPGEPFTHLFTGDTLFQGNCGRSDLAGGDPKVLFKSLADLRQLDPATRVYPGHDYGIKPVTTIGYEKGHNLAMKAKTFDEFDRLP